MKKNIFFTLFWLVLMQEMAAQAPFFSYNLYRYNPAAMSSSSWAANAEYTAYWVGVPGYVKVTDVNLQKRIPKFNSAVGFDLYNKTQGEGNTLRRNYNLSYTYQWTMSKKENSPTLALALQSGIFQGFMARYGVMGSYQEYKLFDLFLQKTIFVAANATEARHFTELVLPKGAVFYPH